MDFLISVGISVTDIGDVDGITDFVLLNGFHLIIP